MTNQYYNRTDSYLAIDGISINLTWGGISEVVPIHGQLTLFRNMVCARDSHSKTLLRSQADLYKREYETELINLSRRFREWQMVK